jgi:hypothetical protein
VFNPAEEGVSEEQCTGRERTPFPGEARRKLFSWPRPSDRKHRESSMTVYLTVARPDHSIPVLFQGFICFQEAVHNHSKRLKLPDFEMRKSNPGDIGREAFEENRPAPGCARKQTRPRAVDLHEVFHAVL